MLATPLVPTAEGTPDPPRRPSALPIILVVLGTLVLLEMLVRWTLSSLAP